MRTERRIDTRERIFQRASVVFNGRQSMFDCAVRNRSATGAMVRLADWTALPAIFDLDIAGQGGSVRVRQCWRRGDDVGVAFLTEQDRPAAEPISLDAARARRAAGHA